MLGWVLKRGLESATGAPAAAANTNADDTQLEQPDTPAPVFAARAFKHALFGTPAPNPEGSKPPQDARQPGNPASSSDAASKGFESPTKPPGILLTPGTGTSRRKRVSFGHDVMDKGAKQDDWVAAAADDDSGFKPLSRPRTRLSEALERSRKQREAQTAALNAKPAQPEAKEAEDAWEEVEDLDRDPDVTVDLNEPHSQSGKYWKSEFQKYHEEAKAEMEKLVKYKQLAKSFAKKKDAEALELGQKLKEEQEKVARMEGRIAELAGQMAARQVKGGDQDSQEIMDTLAQQTALTVQYRDQVKELEALIGDPYQDPDDKARRRRQVTSPRTTKTLLETQRELRKAREQVKELGELRQEVRRLKADLASVEKREYQLEAENKRLGSQLPKGPSSRDEDLEQRLRRAEDEIRRKDDQYGKLKESYDTLKENAKSRYAEAREVLQRKNGEISELRKQLRALKGGEAVALKQDLKDMSAGQRDPDMWSKKLAELQSKLKAEQDARQREKEDASITINRLEKESGETMRSERLRNRRSREELDTDKHSKRTVAHGETVLAEKQQPADRALSTLSRRLSRRATSTALADRAAQENPVHDERGTDAEMGTTASRAASTSLARRSMPSRDRPSRVPAEPGRYETRRASRLPDVQAALDALRPSSPESDEPSIDLVQSRFKKLGGPDPNSSTVWNTSRSTLPAGRRAAAIARLEQKKAERRKGKGSSVFNKENLEPY